MDEFDIIKYLFRPLAGPDALDLCDDAALLSHPAKPLVITTDTMTHGVHFLPNTPARMLARKLMRVNLSDLAAMAATPVGYTLNITGPLRQDWLTDFAAGLHEDQEQYGVKLLGGDTCMGIQGMTLTITMFGQADNPLRRSGARAGDLLALTNPVGEAVAGLSLARGDIPMDKVPAGVDGDRLMGRYHLPTPRLAIAKECSAFATAAIDISDGLFGEAQHLAMASNVGLDMRHAGKGISLFAMAAVADYPARQQAVCRGGDDYELLIAMPPDTWESFEAICTAQGCHAVQVGVCTADPSERLPPENRPAACKDFSWADFIGWRHSLSP